MTWLQQLALTVLFSQLTLAGARADVCADVTHVPDADVAYQPDGGPSSVDLTPGLQIDVGKVQVPVTVDVLRKGGRGRGGTGGAMGETMVGVATTDGQGVTLYGPAINDGEPVRLGPDCRPLVPGERAVAPRED